MAHRGAHRRDRPGCPLRGVFGSAASLEVREHGGAMETIDVTPPESGHGGGDDGTMRAFVAHASNREVLPTDIESAIESHLLAFAAEQARLEDRVIDMAAVRARIPRQ